MGAISVLIGLLILLLSTCSGGGLFVILEDAQEVEGYDLSQTVTVDDFYGTLSLQVPEGWVSTEAGVLFLSPDGDRFEEGVIDARNIPESVETLGNLFFLARDNLADMELPENPTLEDIARFYTLPTGTDERGLRSFSAGGKPAIIATSRFDDGIAGRNTTIQVFVEVPEGFAVLTFNTTETRPLGLEDLARAIAGTFDITPY